MITSAGNAQIKRIIALQKKSKLREEENVFVVEGQKLFEEIVQNRRSVIEKVYVSESYRMKCDLTDGLLVEVVSDSVFRSISETVTPQGILTIVTMPDYHLEDILKQDKVRLLILEDLRDPGNLGTIMRTAEAAGFDGIILSRESVDMYNPKVVRSTMGAIFRMPFFYIEDFNEMLKRLQNTGFILYATHLHGAVDYTETAYAKKTAVLIGNEANGLSEQSAHTADYRIKIPMEGQVESLNAAVAAAVVMFEVKRQQNEAGNQV